MFVGIGVSGSRGLDLCAVDERRRVCLIVKARDLTALMPVLGGFGRDAIFAIDAPPRPAVGLLPGKEHRVAEHDLRAMGFAPSSTPSTEDGAPPWMREGFALFGELATLGFPLFTHGEAGTGVAIEVYPHLSYVALSGARRGGAPKIEWSQAVLRGKVVGLPAGTPQDTLDAACAALTAWHFAHGRWVGFGEPGEGVVIAPEPKGDLVRPTAAGAGQLSLAIDAPARPRSIAPARASTFAERVAALAARIPAGRVATFSDLARWAGKPAGARAVGTIVKARAYAVPCHRVVSATGEPPPFPVDAADRLRAEGVPMTGRRVDLAAARWVGPS